MAQRKNNLGRVYHLVKFAVDHRSTKRVETWSDVVSSLNKRKSAILDVALLYQTSAGQPPHCDYEEKEGLLFHYTVTLIRGKRNKQIGENVVIQLHIVDLIIDTVFGIYEQRARWEMCCMNLTLKFLLDDLHAIHIFPESEVHITAKRVEWFQSF